MAELDDHVRRVLRSEFASGIVDYPTQKSVVDVEGGFETSRRIAEQSIVLLKNEDDVLPLDPANGALDRDHRGACGHRDDLGRRIGAGGPAGASAGASGRSTCVVSDFAAEGSERESSGRERAV